MKVTLYFDSILVYDSILRVYRYFDTVISTVLSGCFGYEWYAIILCCFRKPSKGFSEESQKGEGGGGCMFTNYS